MSELPSWLQVIIGVAGLILPFVVKSQSSRRRRRTESETHVNVAPSARTTTSSSPCATPRRGVPGRRHGKYDEAKLPLYLGFFEFVHNARRRGKALLGALVAALVV